MKRNSNLDLLRVISSLMVLIIHISSPIIQKNLYNPNFDFMIANLFDSFSRTAVPIFILLSGGFILESENIQTIMFYKKIFRKLFLPTLFFSFLYVVWSYIILILFAKYKEEQLNFETVILPLKNWISGEPYYHLWYLYMILFIYLCVPYLIGIKEKYGEKKFFYFGVSLMIFGFFQSFYNELFWFLKFLVYLGYFILGYSLKKIKIKVSLKKIILIYFISSIFIFLLTEILNRKQYFLEPLYFYKYLSPFVISGSLSLYLYFIKLNTLNLKIYYFQNISKITFYIYIVHAGILNIIDIFRVVLKLNIRAIVYIPIVTIIVFTTSIFIACFIINKEEKNQNIGIKSSF